MGPSDDSSSAGLPDRIRLVVVFGGVSAEHDVSCVSAREVVSALDPDRYEIVPVGIRRDGEWVLASDAQLMLGRGAADELPTALSPTGEPIDLLPELHSNRDGLPTVVFPVLHGPNGEDGTIQGMLELAGVAYVGSGVLGSALAMDKAAAKEMLAHRGLPQARHRAGAAWDLTGDEAALDDISADLGFPLFVKPSNMGSSIGVSKAHDRAELERAVELALGYDETVVFEEFVAAREIEVGVLGNETPRASVPGEIIPGAEFYDYEDKYRDGTAKLVIPAALPAGVADEVAELALAAYRAVRAEVLARVDFFYEETGRGLLVNEVNTMPGCTPVSMFPLLWQASGLSYRGLLDEVVRLALARHARRGR
ncbi:MAG TPA: D-alanine--D-alanine ligase family protein [Microthrixaceae bacterium]|nr:D-alanine--D-alanine ligase family protein [Microthrixaceae bacterium]